MEEGKHIIHYLINYAHYMEGKSEPRSVQGSWGQHACSRRLLKGIAATPGGENLLLCKACAWEAAR